MMNQIEKDREGMVFNLQRFSVHDGPGIRTIVFLKGCPLSCKWCSNPESQKSTPEVMYNEMECVHCGKCLEACKHGAISVSNPYLIDRSKCIACGDCVNACPTEALTMKGKMVNVWKIIRELQKDAIVYRRSGGGITLSGGEPLAQYEYARELLKACKEQGWHTAIETSCMATPTAIEEVMPWIDLALLDIKSVDPLIHQSATDVTNEVILRNVVRVSELTNVIVRVPVIPGVNDSEQAIADIAQFAKTMRNVNKIHLLPYHTYGENKYKLLGRDYPMGKTPNLSEEGIGHLKKVVEALGFECVVGG